MLVLNPSVLVLKLTKVQKSKIIAFLISYSFWNFKTNTLLLYIFLILRVQIKMPLSIPTRFCHIRSKTREALLPFCESHQRLIIGQNFSVLNKWWSQFELQFPILEDSNTILEWRGQMLRILEKCFAFDVLLRSSKDDTHQHLYNQAYLQYWISA